MFKIIISGGGTGGHIFPAIAIADALKKKYQNIDILFVGAKGKMEMNIVPARGYKIIGLWISGIQRRFSLRNLLFPVKLLISMLQARKIVNHFKPDAVIGVGGFVSGPLLWISAKKHIPTLIQEQNFFPGITNKFLAKYVDKICVAYPNMEAFFAVPKEKIVITGNPVRQDILNSSNKRNEGLKYFNLNSNKKTVLVIGGSLGAKSINEAIFNGIEKLKERNIQIIWQTGRRVLPGHSRGMEFYYSSLSERLGGAGVICDFITRMDFAYAVADLVVSRAGAIAISEICATGKPAILVPSPNVAEDHQTKNAKILAAQNAAILIVDTEVKEKLIDTIILLIEDEKKLSELKNNISKLAMPDSADLIADEVLKLIK